MRHYPKELGDKLDDCARSARQINLMLVVIIVCVLIIGWWPR